MPDAAGAASRALAIEALVRIEGGAHAHVLVPEMLRRSALAARDRGFVTDQVYGTVRLQRLLDAWLGSALDRPLDALDPPVRAALRLGAHQLHTGVPAHAAVSATVDAAPARARALVNAVLRRVARTRDEPADLATRTSHPDWIVDRLVAALGETTARAVLDADNAPPGVTLRLRRGARPSDVADELRAGGTTVTPGALVPHALVVHGGGDPAAWTAVRDGRATVQDQASQAVVEVVSARAGEHVLDVAAAPGGKAAALADAVGPTGVVVALDLHEARARRVAATSARLGLAWLHAVVADGRRAPLTGAFDAVLVDAPCTGLGVLRRRPDARWRVSPDAPVELAALQRALVGAAWPLVRPGGRLVYSVCTWTAEETEAVGAWMVAELDGAAVIAPGAPWQARGVGGQLLPSDGGDGMFVCAVRRDA